VAREQRKQAAFIPADVVGARLIGRDESGTPFPETDMIFLNLDLRM
jgi:hypothetical protein